MKRCGSTETAIDRFAILGHPARMRWLIFFSCAGLVSGCVVRTIASTAVDIATLPVKVVSATVDATTTSQAEADQKAGRKLRQEQERQGKELRLAQQRCRKGKPLPADDCAAILRQ